MIDVIKRAKLVAEGGMSDIHIGAQQVVGEFVDEDGDRWYIDQDGSHGLERLRDGPSTWNLDEYGDRSYMWDYM